MNTKLRLLIDVYSQAETMPTGSHFTTINELTDQLPATRPEVLEAAVDLLIGLGPIEGNKILTEEDKGALMAGIICVRSGKPIAMARWYSYAIRTRNSVVVPIDMEYAKGQLLVNGILPGDKLAIIDDTLSTGGTALSLIKAAREAGAEISEMRVVVEKLGFGGREKLMKEAGVSVRAVLGIEVGAFNVKVKEIYGQPCSEEVNLE